jgi:hypothetical protein
MADLPGDLKQIVIEVQRRAHIRSLTFRIGFPPVMPL